jgi:hypothetical protein
MNKAWLLALFLFCNGVRGDGLIKFENWGLDLRTEIGDVPGTNYLVGLLNQDRIIFRTTFLEGTGFFHSDDPVAIPGTEPGQRVVLYLAVWPTACCEGYGAFERNISQFVSEPLGGTNSQGEVFATPNVTVQPFTIFSTILGLQKINEDFSEYGKPEAQWTNPGQFDHLKMGGQYNPVSVAQENVDYVRNFWKDADGKGGSIHLGGIRNKGGIGFSLQGFHSGYYAVVRFWMSGNPSVFENEPTLKKLRVSSSAIDSQEYTYDTAEMKNTFQDMKWQEKAFIFLDRLHETSTYLQFSNETQDALGGPVIDNVRIEYYLYGSLAIKRVAPNRAQLSFSTCPQIEYQPKTRLAGGEWQDVGGKIMGNGFTNTVEQAIDPSEPSREFRIHMLMPSYVVTD